MGYNVALPPTKPRIIPTKLSWLDGAYVEEYWLFVSSLMSFVLASCNKHMDVGVPGSTEDHEAFTCTPLTGYEGTGRPVVWVAQMWESGNKG